MERTISNTFLGFRKPGVGASPRKSDLIKGDRLRRDNFVKDLRGRVIAIAIFLYYFIQAGTLGLIPQKYYMVYKSLRLSDMIMVGLVIYSLACVREYMFLFRSKSFLITKIFFGYLILEFFLSFIQYHFDILEYTFRLNSLWSSFLVFPFLLLYKRGGWEYLFKLIFPVAIISSVLYILTALTGIAFMPDVTISTQILPGGITIYRVYGGTFFGEFFFLGIIYFWITRKFRLWQLPLVILFAVPHILAFGRNVWVYFIFTILGFVILNTLKKKQFVLLFRQAVLLVLVIIAFIFCFIEFIPESDYYVNALAVRIFQGKDDVQYNEGTYGTRVIFQSNSLVKLWSNSNILIGVGMHPMWVVRPESFEEQVYYNAFCDVQWPAVLAAYGLFGLCIALIFQFYYIVISWKIIKKMPMSNLQSFLVSIVFIKMIFDTFLNFNYGLVSVGLLGLVPFMHFSVAIIVFNYEKFKQSSSPIII